MAQIDHVQPSRRALEEALRLADDLLRNIELSEVSLSACCLKASRLARLLNDLDFQLAFEYEASGYPAGLNGLTSDVWNVAEFAGRVYSKTTESVDGRKQASQFAYTESVEVLEEKIAAIKIALAATDKNGHALERTKHLKTLSEATSRLATRRGFVHQYVSRKYDELRFSEIADDIFSRIRAAVDEKIGSAVPAAVSKFLAVHDNLQSENPEDWANAVHSCRRILQDLADAVQPAGEDVQKEADGRVRTIKMGPDNYINRLAAYAERHSHSRRFEAIVGSNLSFLGDRLDAAFAAAQKGSHSDISSREEADRYVVYTYMLVADILTL